MRRAARVDDNQPAVVNAYRHAGWEVAHTHQVGDGFPDLVISRGGFNLLVEIKDEQKPPSKRKLTPAETEFHTRWRGPIITVISPSDALQQAGHAFDQFSNRFRGACR